MVTNALAPLETVTGGEVINLGALLAQIAAEQQLAFQGQAGYYNPNAFTGGMAGYQPTLERELGMGQLDVQRQQANTQRDLGFGNLALGKDQLAAAIRDADRQFQLDVQRFGLSQAEFNYQQRLGEATTRLQQLGLLSSLSGPKDFLRYNYVLNDMAAPPGQQVDPFQLTAGMNQPYSAPPIPDAPPFQFTDPTTLPGAQGGGGSGGGSGGMTPPQTAPRPAAAPVNATAPQQQTYQPASSQTSITGNPQSDAAFKASAWAGAPPEVLAEFDRISQQMASDYAKQVQNVGGYPGYADGGAMQGGMAIVGDSKSGRETGHEEAVMGDFVVLPNEIVKELGLLRDTPRAYGGGVFPAWGQQRQRNDVQLDPMENPNGQWGQLNQYLQPWMQWLQNRPTDGQGWQGWYGQMPQLPGRGGQTPPAGGTPSTPPAGNVPGGAPQTVGAFQNWYDEKTGRQNTWKGTQWQGRQPNDPVPNRASIPRMATGGAVTGSDFFNFNTYKPQDTTNAPFVKKSTGQAASPAFQARGEDLGPYGRQPFNYGRFLTLNPSEQEMMRGYIETPTAMGGLGAYFADELERARRSSFQGSTFAPAAYG